MSEKVSMDANDFPFDAGVVVSSGPYRFSLLKWRQYYTNNVIFTKAITHEAFVGEYPEAAAALADSDRKTEQYRKLREQLGGMSLTDIMVAMAAKRVTIKADTVREAEDAPAGEDKAGMKDHAHAWGEGMTGEAEGHAHKIVDGVCQETMGHTHDAPAAAQPDDAGEKQED